MDKHTKIVATIGPASCKPDMLGLLRRAGMNAARINLSHGDHTSQAEYIRNIRNLDKDFPIILDTKGPVLAITRDRTVLQFLQLVRGVFPMLDNKGHLDLGHYDMSYQLVRKCYELGLLKLDDGIIITSGSNLMKKRGTNLMEIYNVCDIIGDRSDRKSSVL
ncbi:MAG: pyruvate kinase [Desulfobacterales bacterium]|jgi:pyruvate kinase